jgi:hypothetical protein
MAQSIPLTTSLLLLADTNARQMFRFYIEMVLRWRRDSSSVYEQRPLVVFERNRENVE